MTRCARHPAFPLLWLVLVLISSFQNSVQAQDDNDSSTTATTPAPTTASSSSVTFIETPDNFATSAAAANTAGLINPIKLAFWTTPNRDWSSQVMTRLKGLVARFDAAHLVVLHPHQAVTDHEGTCRAASIDEMTEDCLSRCVNAGRYCYIQYPDLQDNSHAGLEGADIVEESVRRLCIWKEYAHTDVMKLFDYVAKLKETNCDQSLSDNCISRVLDDVQIDENRIADCFHDSGGVGSQIDMKNEILEQELHRSKHILNISSVTLPHLAINSFVLTNLTSMSDWQIMAAVCNAFPMPKPALCDFCLLECPHGNDDHDPTRQCLWDLTCGDNRNLDDWMQGTGPVFGNVTNNNATDATTTTEVTIPPVGPTETAPPEEEQPPAETSAPENTTPPAGDSTPLPTPPLDINGTETISNATEPEELDHDVDAFDSNATTTNETQVPAVALKPPPHNEHTPTVASTPETEPPAAAPKPKPTPSLPPYMGNGVLPQPPTPVAKPHTTHAPHTRAPHSGGHAHTPVQKKPANTTDPKQAIGGLLIGIIVLSVLIVGVAVYRKWSSGKDFYATVVAADREEGGLASTASHAAEQDLELHVEMSGSRGSNGYAPPASASRGTWG